MQFQVLRVLDYSRFSRHLLSTAGDEGSVHIWDTTGRTPKVSKIISLYAAKMKEKLYLFPALTKKLISIHSGTFVRFLG